MTGVEFEQYVGALLKHQGYKVQFTSTSNDFGVDIIAWKDGCKYVIQCKRYKDSLNREAISDAVAGASDKAASVFAWRPMTLSAAFFPASTPG